MEVHVIEDNMPKSFRERYVQVIIDYTEIHVHVHVYVGKPSLPDVLQFLNLKNRKH